ncbi:abortive phage infection protein [Streptomyces varsoviensis]|uniref:abortive phage infection protein n=1 Tax=Streptomyces varsoviensis TaxID=67373 RepID=UPI0034012768
MHGSRTPDAGISRKQFLAAAAALGVAGATMRANPAAAAEPASAAAAGADGHSLCYRGVCYTVGAGETPATAYNADRMREDVRAIKERLHANSIKVTGDGVDRLTTTAEAAAQRGLHLRIEPTLGDRPPQEILDHLAETGRYAEQLRRDGARVELSVGCEFFLFVPGIVPGDDAVERVNNLASGNYDAQHMRKALARFTARAAKTGRSVFRGPLSYAAAQDEDVDWSLFDILGIDYYSYHPRRQDYVRELRRYLRHGKPVTIAEFGTCPYRGAPAKGGMGWHMVDYSKKPPRINEPLVRSEQTQADYLSTVYNAFEATGLYSAYAFEFITPDAPHWPNDPHHDLDMVSYSIVKTIQDTPGTPDSPWHWEPKQAFHTLARHFARAGSHRTIEVPRPGSRS